MVRIFLATANVGSVFESIEKGLPVWLNEFISVIRSKEPEFVAVHFQETGGKNYQNGSDVINIFFRQLVERMKEINFRRAEGFVDSRSDLEDQFTALASVYFVRETLKSVQLWDFQEKKFVDASSTTKLYVGEELEQAQRKQKEKFPQDFFPNCKWSRKGFLRTRWRIAGVTLDLVNIHLFHDSCNLIAASAFPSPFAQNREKTMKYTLEKLQSDAPAKCPMFIFGDFNFRVNTYEVLDKLRQEFSDDKTETQLILDSKRFDCPDHERRFKEDYQWLKPYDFEAKQLSDILYEESLNFHPTYPFEEDDNLPETFLRTRCPSWCDRVLFTQASKDIISKESPVEYSLMGSKVCMGDHKPVFLHFCLTENNSVNHVNEISEAENVESSGPGMSRDRSLNSSSSTNCTCNFVDFLRGNLFFRSNSRRSSNNNAVSNSYQSSSSSDYSINSVPSSSSKAASVVKNFCSKKCVGRSRWRSKPKVVSEDQNRENSNCSSKMLLNFAQSQSQSQQNLSSKTEPLLLSDPNTKILVPISIPIENGKTMEINMQMPLIHPVQNPNSKNFHTSIPNLITMTNPKEISKEASGAKGDLDALKNKRDKNNCSRSSSNNNNRNSQRGLLCTGCVIL